MTSTQGLNVFSRAVLCCAFLISLTPSVSKAAAHAAARFFQDPGKQERVDSEIERQKQRLKAAEVEERRDAVMRLGAIHRAEASRLVIAALSDPAPIVRIAAAVAVRTLPVAESTPLLLPLLADLDPFVRQEAAYALGSIHNRGAISSLVERLNTDRDVGVRGAAAVALGIIADEEAVVPLAQLLSPTNPSRGGRKSKDRDTSFIQRSAARSLGQIRSRAGVAALIAALSNESLALDIRREAAESLGLIADPAAGPVLRATAAATDPRLSQVAFNALRKSESASPTKMP
jgi:HEAT repeat protein